MTRHKLSHLDRLDEAAAEVAIAKLRLGDTIDGIKSRLRPSNIIGQTKSCAKAKSTELVESASDLARRRPTAVMAGVIGSALFLARKPLRRLARRRFAKR